MKRPKYLLDVDAVQDALNEAGSRGVGLTMRELVSQTKLNYSAVQQATVRLRNDCRINFEQEGRTLRFYCLHQDRKT